MENNNPWYIEGSSKARLVTVTPNGEEIIAYVARVTSKDQSNPNIKGLLKYCAKHGHWSIYDQADLTVEIVTPLAISIQILRHASNKFQQFSGRYENQEEMRKHTDGLPAYENMFYIPEEARLQDTKNRQNSIVAEDPSLTDFMWKEMEFAYKACSQSYRNLISAGFAKELARFVLPEGVYTRLYMKGSVRSFYHYIKVRDDEGVAQHEHCEVAKAIREIFSKEFPTVYDALCSSEQNNLQKENEELKAEIQVLKAQLANRF
jgi:thymidylate synthase (FAD)